MKVIVLLSHSMKLHSGRSFSRVLQTGLSFSARTMPDKAKIKSMIFISEERIALSGFGQSNEKMLILISAFDINFLIATRSFDLLTENFSFVKKPTVRSAQDNKVTEVIEILLLSLFSSRTTLSSSRHEQR